jgi:polar amino acid transport system ATP-binding protein
MMSNPVLSIHGIHKSYGDLEVLKGVDLTLNEGHVLCVIGPSGSGKSTLLRCVNHLERADRGVIYVDGELVGYRWHKDRLYELAESRISRQRSKIGIVFQHFNLFPHLTVLDNITVAPIKVQHVERAEIRQFAMSLLESVGLADKANAYPNQLSGGQAQRVGITRALAMRPRLMLLDEPTSALDPELVGDVLEVIRDMASQGMTMMVVTHEMAFAREVADSVAFMADGEIVEHGPPDQVLGNPQHDRTRAFLRRVTAQHGEPSKAVNA